MEVPEEGRKGKKKKKNPKANSLVDNGINVPSFMKNISRYARS